MVGVDELAAPEIADGPGLGRPPRPTRRALVVASVAVLVLVLVGAAVIRGRPDPVSYVGGPGLLPAVEVVEGDGDLPGTRIEALPEAPFGARDDASAVWTGSELIIWGGADTTAHADGAALDLATGTWRMLAPAPLSPRVRHAAVWTGTELVIWGGSPAPSGVGRLLDGAAYDPATDRWRPLADAPAGTDRSSATAVLAGGKVVIGGGTAPTTSSPAVLVYDPASDRWAGVEVAGETTAVTALGPLVAAVTIDRSDPGAVRLVGIDPARAAVVWTVPVPVPDRSRVDGATVTTDGDDLIVLTSSQSTGDGATPRKFRSVITMDATDRSVTRILHTDDAVSVVLSGMPGAAGRFPFLSTGGRLHLFGSGGLATIDPRTRTARTEQTHDRFCGSPSMAAAVAGDRLLVWGGQGSCGGDAVRYVGAGASITFG